MNLNFLLFILCFYSITTVAQNTSLRYSQEKLNITITEQIDLEAEKKGIKNDKAIISFDVSANCEIDNFKIFRPAKMESLNIEILNQKNKIIEQIKKLVNCNGKSANFKIPLTLNYY